MNVLMRFLTGAIVFLFSISAAIMATTLISPLVYSYIINWFNLDTIAGLTAEELMINYKVIVDYLINPAINQLQMPYFSMSEGGAVHFEEVKVLFFINFVALIILFFGLSYLVYYIRKNNLQLYVQSSFRINLLFPLVLLFFIVVAFEQVFVLFHRILFNNDLWLFNPLTDPVINVLPQELFMILFIIALLLYEVILILIRWIVNLGK